MRNQWQTEVMSYSVKQQTVPWGWLNQLGSAFLTVWTVKWRGNKLAYARIGRMLAARPHSAPACKHSIRLAQNGMHPRLQILRWHAPGGQQRHPAGLFVSREFLRFAPVIREVYCDLLCAQGVSHKAVCRQLTFKPLA
jgi:hypothetical protein